MVDIKKRNTLKALGGSAVIAVAPTAASATCLYGEHTAVDTMTMEEIVVPVTSSGTELTIALSVDPTPTIRLTNHSDRLVIVRHVHPGIVHAGRQAFDINSIFSGGAYAIRPGTSRVAVIKPTVATAPETGFPRQLYRNKPQRVAAVTGRDSRGILANSSRSFFS